MLEELDDRQLVLRCRNREEDAFRVLLGRYEAYIYTICSRMTGSRQDALEMVQEAMIRAVLGLDRYQINRPFKPWLRQVVVNTGINFLRRREPEALSLDADPEGEDGLYRVLNNSSPAGDPAVWLERMEQRRTLRAAMAELPADARLALHLRHEEGLSYDEIAREMGAPLGTIKALLFRARQRLRKVLSDQYGWEG